MRIQNATFVIIKGEMSAKTYSRKGQLEFYQCPVCYTKYIYQKSWQGFNVKSTIKVNSTYLVMMVFGFLCAFSGFLFCFNSKDDSAASVAIFFLIVGIIGTVKYLNFIDQKQFIQNRIKEYKEKGKVPD